MRQIRSLIINSCPYSIICRNCNWRNDECRNGIEGTFQYPECRLWNTVAESLWWDATTDSLWRFSLLPGLVETRRENRRKGNQIHELKVCSRSLFNSSSTTDWLAGWLLCCSGVWMKRDALVVLVLWIVRNPLSLTVHNVLQLCSWQDGQVSDSLVSEDETVQSCLALLFLQRNSPPRVVVDRTGSSN